MFCRSRHRLSIALVASVVSVLSLAACSNGSTSTSGGGEPVRGGDVVFLESGEFTSFAQQNLRLWQNSSVAVNIFDQLVFLDPKDGTLQPWLASEWSVNDDATEVLLTLRDGVTFSDGSALTPAVVVANLNRFGTGDTTRGYTPSRPQFSTFKSAEPVGTNQVRIHLSRPDPGFVSVLGDLRHAIVSQSTLDLPFEQASDVTKVIGTGPFVVDSAKGKTEIKIVRRAGYDWGPKTADHAGEAYLDSVTYIVSSEPSSRTGLLLSGQAQIARDISITDEKRLSQNGFHYYGARPFGAVRELAINPSATEATGDLRVRQAISHGIDINEIMQANYNDNWTQATGLVQQNTPGFVAFTGYTGFDAAKANSLLEDAGWNQRDSDGVRTKNGQRLEFTLYPEPNWVVADQDAELIALQLGRIGIGVNVVKVDPTTYTERTTEPTNVFYWNHQTATDVGQLWQFYSTTGKGGNKDATFDELVATVRGLPNGDARTAAVAQVQEYLLDQGLVVPLQETQQAFVTAGKVQGFRTETLGRSALYDTWISQ